MGERPIGPTRVALHGACRCTPTISIRNRAAACHCRAATSWDRRAARIHDSLADPNGGTLRGLRGPGGIQLHSEELARRSRPVNQYLRNESGLGARLRELAILATARELDSQFEWAAHEEEARRAASRRS